MGQPQNSNCIDTFSREIEKSGKVYLNHKPNQSGLHCLADANFSLVDFKWYNGNGLVHPAYECFMQKFFHIQFSMKNSDVQGRDVEFTGKIRSCFPLGGMPPINPSHLEHAEATCSSWIVSTGMIPAHDEKKMNRFRNIRVGYVSTAFTPGLTVEQRNLLVMFNSMLFVLDDWLLDMGSQPFAKLHEIINSMVDVVRGNTSWQEEDGEDHHRIRPFLRALQDMRQEALKHTTEKGVSYFVDAMCEHLLSYSIEACLEWKDLQSMQPALFRKAQSYLRHLTIGVKPFLEVLLISNNIFLDECVRQCFAFQHFRRLFAQQIHIVNDALSFQKEMADKETCNHVIILHVMDGLPLHTALEMTLDEINSLTDQIVKLGELLEELFPEKADVARLVDIVKQAAQGHYFYFQFSPRYGHFLTFDCVVECDKGGFW